MYDALTFLMGEPDNASIIEIADFLDKHNLTASVAEKDENVAAHVNSLLTEVFKTRNRITPKIQLSCNEKNQLHAPTLHGRQRNIRNHG
mgnify:CR=1 FL=1